jgi:hypothetical protein
MKEMMMMMMIMMVITTSVLKDGKNGRLNSMNILQPKQDVPCCLWLIIASIRKWEAATQKQQLIT